MQSHDDYDANKALGDLRKVAEEMTARGENLITAGAPSEAAVTIDRIGGFHIRELPEDPLALRISIGEAHEHRLGETAYLVFRGDPARVLTLLRRSLNALESMAQRRG